MEHEAGKFGLTAMAVFLFFGAKMATLQPNVRVEFGKKGSDPNCRNSV